MAFYQPPTVGDGIQEPGGNPGAPVKGKPTSTSNTRASNSCSSETGGSQDGNATTGNPVIIATGEKLKTETDFLAGGLMGLTLTRTYRSFGAGSAMFGAKWMSSIEAPRLTKLGAYKHPVYGYVPTAVVVTFSDGTKYTYTRGSGSLTYKVVNSAAMGSLSVDPEGDQIAFRVDGIYYTYTMAGAVETVSGNGGFLLGFEYGANPAQPIRIFNSAGQVCPAHVVEWPRRDST